MTRHAPRARFERIMRERVLAAFAQRGESAQHIVLDAARITTGFPVWASAVTPWRLFTGWSETYESVRANPRAGGFEL